MLKRSLDYNIVKLAIQSGGGTVDEMERGSSVKLGLSRLTFHLKRGFHG